MMKYLNNRIFKAEYGVCFTQLWITFLGEILEYCSRTNVIHSVMDHLQQCRSYAIDTTTTSNGVEIPLTQIVILQLFAICGPGEVRSQKRV